MWRKTIAENAVTLRSSKMLDEFVSSSDLEKCSITSVAHQWMLCSEWVPSEWESKQLIKTSHVIHTTPVDQLMSCEEQNCVCKKQFNHQGIVTFKKTNKIESMIYKNISTTDEVHLRLFSDIKIQPHMCFYQTHSFSFLICGLLWCIISCLDSHSDGTHSLQSIHYWASDVTQYWSKSLNVSWFRIVHIFIIKSKTKILIKKGCQIG